ncbi:hypothetical protein [Nitrospira sp. Nam74]
MRRLSMATALLLCVLTSCAQQTSMDGRRAGGILDPTTAPGRLASGNWIDKIMEYVLMQQAVSKEGNYQVYFTDLQTAKGLGNGATGRDSMKR